MKLYYFVIGFLFTSLLFGTQKTVEFPDFVNPSQVIVDSKIGNLYVADGTTV